MLTRDYVAEEQAIGETFLTICRLAIQGDRAALQSHVPDINLQWGLQTPVRTLAKEGQHNAVNLLIDRCQANINHALLGYMEGGFFNHAESLIQLGADVGYAVEGAARYGFEQLPVTEFTHKLRQQIKLEITAQTSAPEALPLVEHLVVGCGAVGNFREVKKIISSAHFLSKYYLIQAVKISSAAAGYNTRRGSFNSEIIYGYALAGMTERVDELIESDSYKFDALRGYAHSGRVKEVYKLLDTISSERNKQHAQILVCTYFYMGGHTQQGYLMLMHLQLTNKIDEINFVLKAIMDEHPTQFNLLLAVLNHHLKENRRMNSSHCLAFLSSADSTEEIDIKKTFRPSFTKLKYQSRPAFLRVLSQIDDDIMRNVITGLPEYASSFDRPLHTDLYPVANKINHLMRQHGLSYRQVHAWRTPEVRHWTFFGIPLIKQGSLNKDTFIVILAKLTSLSDIDARQLFEVMYHPQVRGLLQRSLTSYIGGWFNIAAHKSRAISFKSACDEAKTNKDFYVTVNHQLGLFHHATQAPAKKDEFYRILRRTANRAT